MLIGDSVHVLDEFLPAAEAFSIYHVDPMVQPIYPYDTHYPVEFGIVLSGRHRRLCGNWSKVVGPGDVWFQGVWETHGAELMGKPTSVLVFAVSPECLAMTGFEQVAHYDWMAPFTVPPESRPQALPGVRREILSIASKVVRRSPDESSQAKLLTWLHFLEMMLLARKGWAAPARRNRPAGPESYEVLDRAIGLVLSSRRAISLKQAARVCGLNPNALNRLFRDLMGITFSKYCMRHRLSGGAAQLASTTDPVKAIAKEWGFADASHFHRCFQAQYGCTPVEYRSRLGSPSEDPE